MADYIRIHKVSCLVIAVLVFIIVPSSFYIESPLGFIPYDQAGNVLTYYGAIVGGGMTLGGVAWTINDQNSKRKKDQLQRDKEQTRELKLKYKPIIFFSDSDVKDLTGHIKVENSKLHMYFTIQLKNIGRGEAKKVVIDFDEKCGISECVGTLKYNKTISVVGSKERLTYTIGVPLELFSKHPNRKILKLIAHIEYYGYDDDLLTCNMRIQFYKDDFNLWLCELSSPYFTNL